MDTSQGIIMVVDDNDIFRDRLARALRDRKWEVLTARDYNDALACASQTTPDRAVIDLKMPGKSGLELVRTLHEQYPEMALIILTGYGAISTAVESIKAGAVNYLPKPADADEILFAFEKHEGQEDIDYDAAPTLARAEWAHIQRVLSDCDGNITRTAKKLGIHRRTLQRKLDQYAP